MLLHLSLSFLAFSFALLVLLQAGLVAGFLWLNTGQGQKLIEQQLKSSLRDSGYEARIDRFFYDPAYGIFLSGITVTDERGKLAELDRLVIRIGWARLVGRQLDIAIDGGTLSLWRMPARADEDKGAERKDLHPFTVPDLYVRKLNLSRLSFAAIEIGKEIAGTPLLLAPHIQARIAVTPDKALNLALNLQPRWYAGSAGRGLPEALDVRLDFIPDSLSLSIEKAQLQGPDYEIEAQGSGQFIPQGMLAFRINGAHENLRPQTADHFARGDFIASIGGTYEKPAIDMTGQLVPAALADRGLDNIHFIARPSDAAPDLAQIAIFAKLATHYKGQPAQLQADLVYLDHQLQIDNLQGQAPDISLDGTVHYDTARAVLSGGMKLELDDLAYYQSLARVDLAGDMRIDARFTPTDQGRTALALEITGEKLLWDSLALGRIKSSLLIPDIEKPAPAEGTMRMEKLLLSPSMTVDRAQIDWRHQQGTVYKLSLAGKGSMPAAGDLKGDALIDIDMAGDQVNFSAQDVELGLRLGGSSLRLRGTVSTREADLRLVMEKLDIADLPFSAPAQMQKGHLSGTVAISGASSAPLTIADLVLQNGGQSSADDIKIVMQARHQDGHARATLDGRGEAVKNLSAAAQIPVSFALYPFHFSMADDAPLTGKGNADIDIAPFARLVMPPSQHAEGTVKATADISGTLRRPVVEGALDIASGAFRDEKNGINIQDLKTTARFTADRIIFTQLQATDGENGRLEGHGSISLHGDSTMKLGMHDFHLLQSDMADGVVSADLTLSGDREKLTLGGAVTIEKMDILIPERFQSNIPRLNIVDPQKEHHETVHPARKMMLDLKISAHNQIFVRGWGLDAEFGGTIAAHGNAAAPQFDGTLQSRRGRYEEFGKRFTLARADLRFQGTIPPSPYLDIEATIPAGDVTASILLGGSLTAPSIKFAAVPALPEDEVLSRILFGKNTSRITPLQAIQLAQTMRRFSGQGGGLDPLGMLRDLTGLDNLTVEMDESGQASVGVGKYLSDKVYLEFKRGQSEASGAANLQIEVTPQISVETEIGGDARAGGGVFWRRDY